jgi:ADP-sugar diphosphatase
MFGKNVGFINAEVDAYLNGKKLPGYVFIRGAAVAILLLLNGRMVLTR